MCSNLYESRKIFGDDLELSSMKNKLNYEILKIKIKYENVNLQFLKYFNTQGVI